MSDLLARHAWELAAMPILIVLSAFFSSAETAMFNLTPAQIRRLSQSGRGGKLAASLMAAPRRVLNTLLLANLLVNVAYSAIAAVIILDLNRLGLPGWEAAILSLAPIIVLIMVGEVAPKSIALVVGEPLASLAARPLAVLGKVFAPLLTIVDRGLVWPLTQIIAPRQGPQAVTADELADLLELSARRGVINLQASNLLQEIVALTDIRAADIMVPRVDMIACEINAAPAEVADRFRRSRLRRLPVYEGDIDRIAGAVHAKRFLLNPGKPLRELLAKVPFVPEAANVERVLMQFRVTGTQMAIVVDEYGGTAGLVTLEDVLEEIVGDIPDPHQPPRVLVERISQREYLIDSELNIHEWADTFGTNLSGRRISTIGGFVTSLMGRIPKVGDTVVYRNLRFTVQSMRRRRIEKLRLELMEAAP